MGRARYRVATAAAIALIGCGDEESTPETDQIVRALEHDVQQQTGTQDVLVACGEDVGEGDLCDVTAAGGVKAKVKITRLEDGEVEGVVQP
jgi:hypothetical protein